MRQLVLAPTLSMTNVVISGREFGLDAHLAALDRLPVPTAMDVTSAMIDTVRTNQGISVDELDQQFDPRYLRCGSI